MIHFPFAEEIINEAKEAFKESNPGMDKEYMDRYEPYFVIGWLKPILENLNKEKQKHAFDKLPNLSIDKIFDSITAPHNAYIRDAPTNPYL